MHPLPISFYFRPQVSQLRCFDITRAFRSFPPAPSRPFRRCWASRLRPCRHRGPRVRRHRLRLRRRCESGSRRGLVISRCAFLHNTFRTGRRANIRRIHRQSTQWTTYARRAFNLLCTQKCGLLIAFNVRGVCAYVCKYLYATRRSTNRKQQRSGVGIGILLAVCRSQGSKKWSQAGVASALGRCGDRGGWLPSGRGTRLLTW